MNFIKSNLSFVIIIILVVVLLLQRCGGSGGNVATVKRDTVTSIQYIQQPPVYIPEYRPIVVESKAPVVIPPSYTPSKNQDSLLAQYQALVNKFLTSNRYIDSVPLHDSTGKRVGVVNLDDVVSENKIKTRHPSYSLIFPSTTRTITIDRTLASKGQLYIGGGLSGNKTDLINSFDLGLIYKTKRDHMYGIKAGIGTGGVIQYGASSYWKIKVRMPKFGPF